MRRGGSHTSIGLPAAMPSPHDTQMLPFLPSLGGVTFASGAIHFASSVPSVTARKTSSGEASSSTLSSMSRVAWLVLVIGSLLFLVLLLRGGLRVSERGDAMDAAAWSVLVVVLVREARDLVRELFCEGGAI